MSCKDKLYIIARSDLRAGSMATQAIHAGIQYVIEHPECKIEWYDISNYLAFLEVKDEPSLQKIAEKAQEIGLLTSLVREPALGNSLTAIALEPGERTSKACSCLPLALRGDRR